MPVVLVPPIVLLAPAFLIGAYLGFRRGWRREILTAAGLALVILLRRGVADFFWLVNLVIDRLTRAAAVIIGLDANAEPPQLAAPAELELVASLALLALLVALTYLVANWLGRQAGLDRASRLFGALVGGLNTSVILSRMLAVARPAAPSAVSDGVNLRIPSFGGADIVVPPPPEQALLVTWPTLALIALVFVALVYLVLRRARA